MGFVLGHFLLGGVKGDRTRTRGRSMGHGQGVGHGQGIGQEVGITDEDWRIGELKPRSQCGLRLFVTSQVGQRTDGVYWVLFTFQKRRIFIVTS